MLLTKDFIDKELIDSLEKLKIEIVWLPTQFMWGSFNDGTEYTDYVTNRMSDIRNIVIKDLSPSNLTIVERTIYLGIFMSLIVKDRTDNLEKMLEKALEVQKEWMGFLFYDLFFLLIQELKEMIEVDMIDVKDIWHKYSQIREQYLLERNNKIDDFSEIKANMFKRIQDYLDNHHTTKE